MTAEEFINDLSVWDVIVIWFFMWIVWISLLATTRSLGKAWRNE